MARNLNENPEKLKNIRSVMRGGASVWPKYTTIKKRSLSSDSNMAVDRDNDYNITPFNSDTISKNKINHFSRDETSATERGGIAGSVPDQNDDQTEAYNYLTLIQNVQRKRKFNEISNELNQQSNVQSFDSSLSRRERLLEEMNKNTEIPGKINSNNFKSEDPTNNEFLQKTDDSYETPVNSQKGEKRVLQAEDQNNPETNEVVNLSVARQRRERLQTLYCDSK